jgi:UDP-N-acetylglucosamine 4,6-dehydratase
MDILQLIGRTSALFEADIARAEHMIRDAIGGSRVLVYGAAGSIGKEVARQLLMRRPAALHMVDISENNLVELVRDLRSDDGSISSDLRFLPLDMSGPEMAAFLASEPGYDHVLNLAAMKHVRSEKDAYSLMRMIRTNILDTAHTLAAARRGGTRSYFAVSTDKAKNPANLMGATKRIMEHGLFAQDDSVRISTARFANVAFSDGSLLHGFRQRLQKQQPISAPRDVKRYFVTGQEAGQLCLAALVLGNHREIFFPNLDAGLHLLTFSEIAVRFLDAHGYRAEAVASEQEARDSMQRLLPEKRWPCYFFASDTSGEKPFEEFYAGDDLVRFDRFADIGVIDGMAPVATDIQRYETFMERIAALREAGKWTKDALVGAIYDACPDLSHIETGRNLDSRM